MAVMEVWIVRMVVAHRRMMVGMSMRLARRVVRAVGVPMMVVMHVVVFVIHRLVRVVVLVPLRQM